MTDTTNQAAKPNPPLSMTEWTVVYQSKDCKVSLRATMDGVRLCVDDQPMDSGWFSSSSFQSKVHPLLTREGATDHE